MTKLIEEFDEDTLDKINGKIDWEGLDYYLTEGYAAEDFEGSELAEPLRAYLDARDNLLAKMSDMGVDI